MTFAYRAALLAGSSVVRPELNLDFTTGVLDSRVTFSRPSLATMYDSTGKLTFAPNNLLLNSGLPFNDGRPVADTVDGVNLYTATGTQYTEAYYSGVSPGNNGTFSVVSGQKYILSFYAKPGTANTIASIRLGTTGGTDVSNAGSVVIAAGGGRVFIVLTATSTASNIQVAMSGLAAGKTVLMGGIQLEAVTYQTTPRPYVATTSAAYYGPRFDYDPVTLAPKGLLIEESRTNLLVQSNTFSTTWGNTAGGVLTSGAQLCPDGTTSGWKLAETATTNSFQLTQSIAGTTGSYTLSVYAKAGERSFIRLNLYDIGGANHQAWFNLSSGVVGTVGSGVSTTITAVGGGWYRCAVTYNLTSNLQLAIIAVANADNTLSYAGTAGSGVYVFGAQLETGSFATSYMPTSSSSVTRAADVASMTGANFSSWYRQDEGAFVVEGDSAAQNSGSTNFVDTTFLGASDGTTSNIISLLRGDTGNRLSRFYVSVGGSPQVDMKQAEWATNTSGKLGGAYKLNDFGLSFNGAAASVDTLGVLPTPTQLQIGGFTASSGALNGHIKSLTYYRSRLSNAQLQRLTK